MRKLPKWLMPLIFITIIGAVAAAAGSFADKPIIYLEGSIKISDDLREKAQGIETVFVVLYDADSAMPMPYGAMRETISIDRTSSGVIAKIMVTPGKLQVMRPGSPIPRVFRVKVRLDRDGYGGVDKPGDLTGGIPRVANGTRDAVVMVATLVP